MERYESGRYWFNHGTAVRVAQRLASLTGVRQRVQRCTWENPWECPWYVGPTPAPAPSRVVVDLCS